MGRGRDGAEFCKGCGVAFKHDMQGPHYHTAECADQHVRKLLQQLERVVRGLPGIPHLPTLDELDSARKAWAEQDQREQAEEDAWRRR